VAFFAMRRARRSINKGAQIVLSARDRNVFQQVATRIHQGDDAAGQRLSERERARHRE
jgi:hypothetical protein